MIPKSGLPEGCYRILALCAEPRSLSNGDEKVARVLAGRGLLESLAGRETTYQLTNAGRAALEERSPMPTATKPAQERYAELRAHECQHTSRFEERVCEAEMEEAASDAAFERARDLTREECTRLLESVGIQVYEHEAIDVLRQAVVENLDDGTIEICEVCP